LERRPLLFIEDIASPRNIGFISLSLPQMARGKYHGTSYRVRFAQYTKERFTPLSCYITHNNPTE
jgi:hypothetical protein